LVGDGLAGAVVLALWCRRGGVGLFELFEAKALLRLEIRPAVVVKGWRRAGSAVGEPFVVWQFVVFFRGSTASRHIFLASELAANGGNL
jgi:hypothetical protein